MKLNSLSLKKNLLSFCLLALAAWAFSACEDTVLDPTTHVEGVVTDETTGAPLDSVVVVLCEDRPGPFMGKNPIQEMTTDKNGRYNFTFEWKEEPYTIHVSRRAYKYLRIVNSKLTNKQLVFDYKEVEPLKKRQTLDFDMEALGMLEVQLKNTAPAASSDILTLTISNLNRQNLPMGPVNYPGIVDNTLPQVQVAGNRYVRFQYSVTENGLKRDIKDSVFVKPFQKNVFVLNY